jgi:hypothetical protein
VLSRHSAFEAIAALKKFPAFTGIVLEADVRDIGARELIRSLKRSYSCAGHSGWQTERGGLPEADHNVESFNPKKVLELPEHLFPEQPRAIEAREEILAAEESEAQREAALPVLVGSGCRRPYGAAGWSKGYSNRAAPFQAALLKTASWCQRRCLSLGGFSRRGCSIWLRNPLTLLSFGGSVARDPSEVATIRQCKPAIEVV